MPEQAVPDEPRRRVPVIYRAWFNSVAVAVNSLDTSRASAAINSGTGFSVTDHYTKRVHMFGPGLVTYAFARPQTELDLTRMERGDPVWP